MILWIKNTAGKPDAMLTFALGGFLVTTLTILGSLVSKFTIGEYEFILRQPDTTLVTAFLGATLLAYVNRRNTKDKIEQEHRMMQIEEVESD